MKQITKRLLPEQDFREEIEKIVEDEQIKAGVIISAVGSFSNLKLRIADGKTIREWKEKFEIVSAIGTISQNGCHIHISAADKEGKVIGGHLKQGCIVGTTVEIVLLAFENIAYERVFDSVTGYEELIVEHNL